MQDFKLRRTPFRNNKLNWQAVGWMNENPLKQNYYYVLFFDVFTGYQHFLFKSDGILYFSQSENF